MQVDVVIEQRFYRCIQNKLWTDNAFPYAFWTRYLDVFSQVNIIARVTEVADKQADWKRVDGPGVSFVSLPSYIGPLEFVQSLPKLIGVLRKRKPVERKVIYRVPGILATFYNYFARVAGQKYAVEVVGDPADVFAVGASKNILRPFFKWLFVKMLNVQCKGAVSLSYVTEYSLQKRYPPSPSAFHTHYSSIQLEQSDLCRRLAYSLSHPLKIVCIGNLTQPYKGCDFMLNTLAQLKRQQLECQVTWIGGGYLQRDMQQLAKQLGVNEDIQFLGNLADRQQIRDQLDQADVFILTSRQEGLPRVLIEAMARSLICIATNVGGVPELLSSEWIIQRDNIQQLVDAIAKIKNLSEIDRLDIAKQHYNKALEYQESALAKRRQAMYQHLKESV